MIKQEKNIFLRWALRGKEWVKTEVKGYNWKERKLKELIQDNISFHSEAVVKLLEDR